MSTRKNKTGPHPSPKPAAKPGPLIRDTELSFPRFVLLKASAGAGKTHALSRWYVQLLLSEEVRKKTPNDLRNILAITFTRNATREMRTKILDWFKALQFRDEGKTRDIREVVSCDPEALPQAAGRVLEQLLGRYTDFQVETIDSFMAAVFKASALDLGVPPHFDILLDNSSLMEYAFSRFLRTVAPGSENGRTFLDIARLISAGQKADEAFLWDPTPRILEKMSALHERLSAQTGEADLEDFGDKRRVVEGRVARAAAELRRLIDASGLQPNPRSAFYSRVEPAAREGKFIDILEASFRTVPVKKPAGGSPSALYEKLTGSWDKLAALVRELQVIHARQSFRPYLLAYASFVRTLEKVKHLQEAVFIEDIPKRLSSYLEGGIVPDIYFRLGDRVFHYLIDEFQDTSPIQWANLRPLIENSLALNGSLFLVGDAKQAIYGFREADFRIMTEFEKKRRDFPSVKTTVRELETNYRSGEAILDFVKDIFKNRLPLDEDLGWKGGLSGLTDFHQDAKPENRGQGYVTLTLLERRKAGRDEGENNESGGDEEDDERPERAVLLQKIRDLSERGYAFSDLAVLTYKNDTVVEVTSWLNEAVPRIPILPFSSLDIRTRKVTREMIALLKFLDSPPDELAFCSFLLGDVFRRKLEDGGLASERDGFHRFIFEARREGLTPLYVAFRDRYPALWEGVLERLFRLVGYTPLYDLVVLAYNTFDIFRLFPEEEATLVKLLESIKDFEAAGRNDLREFLALTSRSGDESSSWDIEVPLDIDAVRIMTVHKAKGLEFPVVLLLQYGQPFKPPDFYLDTEEGPVRVLKLNKGLADADPRLRRVYDEARTRDDVDRLNSLYVALTRAASELHIIGVRSAARPSVFPFNLFGDGPRQERGVKTRAKQPRPPRPVGAEGVLRRFTDVVEGPPPARTELYFRRIRRGILIHDLLSRIEFLEEGWEERLAEAARIGKEGAAGGTEEAEQAARRFLRETPLRSLFERRPGRRVHNEFSVCDSLGRLHRLDRVVMDPEGVTVLDYKTGEAEDPEARRRLEEENRAQMRLYLRLMADIQPGLPARGILVYLDRDTREEVE